MVKLADDPAFPLQLGHVNYRALVAEPVGTVAAQPERMAPPGVVA